MLIGTSGTYPGPRAKGDLVLDYELFDPVMFDNEMLSIIGPVELDDQKQMPFPPKKRKKN